MVKYNKAVVVGHFVVSFDNVVNGFLAVVMAPLFFGATNDPIIQLLSSYAAYAALFISGPIGAVTFGRMGDIMGRKKALLISIMGIGVPVVSIGILPTYSTIGIAAPLILISLRLVQGVFKGAEFAGVLIHNHETGNNKTSSSANVVSIGCFGGCVAAVTCWMVLHESMPVWAWRIPFIVGGLLAFGTFCLRIRIPETDDYIRILSKQKISRTPIKDLMRHHRMETISGIAVGATYTTFAYSSMIFGNRLFQQAGYTASQSMLFSMCDLLWISISISICGKIADRIGVLRQIKYGTIILMITAVPVCSLISGQLTLVRIYAYMIIVSFLGALLASCFAAYVLKLFPPTCRYSGFSVTDSLGAIIGGFTPFMMLLFSSLCGSNIGCAIWLYIVTLPTFILVSIMHKIAERRGLFNAKKATA
ncbi:MAG: MFS transporter [Holosporales bacterium]|jgi:MHS family proline/betaine transporter-like MFS transporter|nr:MFS transporter [Holosporales bacterium]